MAMMQSLSRLAGDMHASGEHERATDRGERAERLRPRERADAHRDERFGERQHRRTRGADPAEPPYEHHARARRRSAPSR